MEFLKLWEILTRRKMIFLSVFLLFFGTIVIVTKTARPVYKAEAKILIETSKTLSSLMSAIGLSSGAAGGVSLSSSDTYDTEIAMSQIAPILNELISELKLKKRDGTPMPADKLVTWSFLNTTLKPEPYINIDQYNDAEMLYIDSYSTDRREAVNMSNKLSELYIKNELDRTKAEYKAARLFIEGQINKVKEEYYESLADLKDFQIKEGTVDLNLETQNLINKINTLKSSYEDNEKTIVELGKKLSEEERKLQEIGQFRKDSEQYTNQQVETLKTKLNDLLLNLEGESIEITKEHPDYIKLEKQIDAVKGLILSEAERTTLDIEKFSIDPRHDTLSKDMVTDEIDRETALSKRKLLQRYIRDYQAQLLKVPIKSIQNTKLTLAVSINKDVYGKLLEYITQVGIAESMTLSEIKLVEPASIENVAKQNFPKKMINYVLGLFFGLFLGLTASLFAEYVDNTIKTPDDIKHIGALTLLGIIPVTKSFKKGALISQLDVTMPVVEAYRTVRNSIRFATIDNPPKSIIVTSAMEFEGKSSTASNLAINYSMEGKRVILIDLDLRRPSLYKIWQLPNTKGITNVIADGMSIDEAIIKSNVNGLDIILSGPIPPDPSRLIESQKTKDVIDVLKNNYDLVIIDTPPVLPVNDSIIVGGFTDGAIIVIEAGRATFNMVEHVKESMEKAGINVIGVLLNKFKVQRTNYYHYRYYKSYKA